MTEVVVAADGGNSKTDLVVAAVDGAVLARVAGPGTRPVADGLAATADGLVDLTRRALAAADRPAATPTAAAFYLANVDLPDEQDAMAAALIGSGQFGRLEVENDTLAVLRAGTPEGWGVAITCGAGINAVGRTRDGRVERFLGLGAISGDWGGAEALTVAAIGAAVRAGDGRGPATALREVVTAGFGAVPEEVSVGVHRGEVARARVLTFARAVLETAGRGDPVAVGIVHRLAAEVVDYVRALGPRLGTSTDGLPVVLGGGVLQAAHPVLHDAIENGLRVAAPGAVVRVLDVPPVCGALAAALELAGAESPAVARGRAALRSATPAAAT